METFPIPDTPGAQDPGAGRRLGVDVGSVRIGVAVSNRDATMASPVETIQRRTGLRDEDGADIERLLALVEELEVVEVVVGLPRDLKGRGSQSAQHAVMIARRLTRGIERLRNEQRVRPRCRVQLADERLSTVVATQAMRTSGVKEKDARSRIDQAAAVEILQSWLDQRLKVLPRRLPKPGPKKGIVNR
ncbi:Holliday junction resolvase RuvX [Corynebacterium gerontici]|uniref:Putative pre-16S rRNA nuclease n=1 Tax=Corynebacterium gerontici TaxID=2079234 RepID=A0A3G6J0T1_9CORY|nr:Holliday junction resolvase RuvX [Corynebacterium gerontici]AZA11526.1 Putative Holliday junction resolvase [Corynebacterium gerontici]